MLTNGSTPFSEDGFAAVIADLRRLYLLVGGGSNDLNNASTDVTQEATAAGENANNAFKLRGVTLDTTAPTDQQVLTYIKATKSYAPRSITGITLTSTGTSLISTNNLNDVASAGSSRTNLGVGTGNSVTFSTLSTTSGATIGDALTASKNLAVTSGTLLQGGLRLSTTLMNSSSAVSTNASYILTSGAITITLPSAATHRVYFIGCDVGAAATVSALDGTQNIRGATGVTLLVGKIHIFMSDGGVSWLETRSA